MEHHDSKLPSIASAKKLAMIHHHNHVILVSITYMLTIGVSGLVLCAIGANVNEIARRIGSDNPTVLGGKVFLFRGIGTLFGTLSSSLIFNLYETNLILMAGLLGISLLLFLVPVATSAMELYIYFFCLGICSSVNDIGVSIATRKVHAEKAGPWLGLNGISFGMAAGIVPIIQLLTADFETQYHILSTITFIIACLIFYSTNIDVDEECSHQLTRNATFHQENSTKHPMIEEIHPHYNVEQAVGWMVFCLVGGQVSFNVFIRTYLDETSVVMESNKVHVLALFWFLVGCSRIAGVYDQKYYIITTNDLVRHLTVCCSISAFFLFLIGIFPHSNLLFWLGVAFYAFFFGPCMSFSYDLNNRLTLPTEKSTIIVMRGVNLGASLVPYITGYLWDYFDNDPTTFMLILAILMTIPLILVQFVQDLSYKSTVDNFHNLRQYTLHNFISIAPPRKLKAAVNAIMGINRIQNLMHGYHQNDHSDHLNKNKNMNYDTLHNDSL